MSKKMLIDGTHAEELRVVVTENDRLEDFEIETTGKTQNKGNIYVAEVSRVEPSLQAAFITYGSERNGFLAFGELHPAFFDVPDAEKDELLGELRAIAERKLGRAGNGDSEDGDEDDGAAPDDMTATLESRAEGAPEGLSSEEMDEDARALMLANQLAEDTDDDAPQPKVRRRGGKKGDDTETEAADAPVPAQHKAPIHRRYKIDEVLKPGQTILVQVVKEERGNKGAALTTYFTFPGRYTVLMPNTPYAGGISRKVTDRDERKAMKKLFEKLNVPADMGLILRTAGLGQPPEAIEDDFKNLAGLWQKIEKDYKKTDGIACVYEEGSVVVRALRDMAHTDLEDILIEGKRVYKQIKEHAKALMPDLAKKIKEYKAETPVFVQHGVEQQLNRLHRTRVELPSGGYIIINPTEALISIDINSGSATQGRNIEETALKTNLEAADEIARQIRLRDLAGLIVIDFIDMERFGNVRDVERYMRKLAARDRARLQVGRISDFGLMELSRQRLRPSFVESHYTPCPHCNGTGQIHSLASSALMVLRRLEEKDAQGADKITVNTAPDLALFILNNKRALIQDMEAKYKYKLVFQPSSTHFAPDFQLVLTNVKADGTEKSQTLEVVLREQPEEPPEVRYKKSRNSKRTRQRKTDDTSSRKSGSDAGKKPSKADTKAEDKSVQDKPVKPKRATRRRKGDADSGETPEAQADATNTPETSANEEKATTPDKPKRAPRRRKADASAETAHTADNQPTPDAKPEAQPETPLPQDKPVEVVTVGDAPQAAGATEKKPSEAVTRTFQRWWGKA